MSTPVAPRPTKRVRGSDDSHEEEEEEEAVEVGEEGEQEEEVVSPVPSPSPSNEGSPAAPAAAEAASSGTTAMDEDDDEPAGDSLPASRRGAVAHLNRQIRALQKEKKTTNAELARYKIALANSNHALMRNSIDIPDNAKVTGGIVDSTEVANSQRALVLRTEAVAEINVPRHEFPYRWDLTGIPDTSTIVSDTKFDIRLTSLPHGVCRYQRTAEKLAPHMESRRPIPLTWKLINRQDPKIVCSEKDLKPGQAAPKIYYRLKLVYADDGSEVTMESLDTQGNHIPALSEPNIIGTAKERVQGGCVTFKIKHLHVLSSMTKPLHRKFRFELECLDEQLKVYEHAHAQTFDFYSVARIRIKGQDA